MGPGETIVLIVLIVSVAGVLRAILGGGRRNRGELPMPPVAMVHGLHGRRGRHMAATITQENEQLRNDVASLKARVAVLERVITDQSSGSALEREFEKLKSMD